MREPDISLSDDLLKGARQIAEFTGFTERQIFYYAEKKKLPLFRVGSAICGRKSQLSRTLSAEG